MERTLVLVKPDGVARGLVGEILQRFERKGLKIVGLKMLLIDHDLAVRHYAEHAGKPFYGDLISFITSGPTVAMVLEGDEAIAVGRLMIGDLGLLEARPGTVRGDYSMSTRRNLVHASDSPESAAREIDLFFTETELTAYERADESEIYD